MGKKPYKQGYALLSVMIASVFVVALILASGLSNSSLNRQVIKETRVSKALWAAEAGMEDLKSLLTVQVSPLGTKGLPAPQVNMLRGNLGGGVSYSLSATNISPSIGRYIYQLSCTGRYKGTTKTITQIAQLDSMARNAFGGGGNKTVKFTGNDRIIGEVYMNGLFSLLYYNNQWPKFTGFAYSTSDHVKISGGSITEPNGDTSTGEVSYPDGHINEVFEAGVFLNYPEMALNDPDFLTTISSSANHSFSGGDYQLTFTTNGTMQYVKGSFYSGSFHPNTSDPDSGTKNLTGSKTYYFSGDISVKGTLNGKVTIGSAGKCIIEDEGIRYASAPDTVDPLDWTPDEVANIKNSGDMLGMVIQNEVICMGLNNIEVHGAILSMANGMYPDQREHNFGVANQPGMYVYGSLNESILQATEWGDEGNGFGMKITCDPRFSDTSIPNFPNRNYSYRDWTEY